MGKQGFRRGIAVVWSAMILTVMVLMMALSLSWGKVAWNMHQLQNAADAAALAGAMVVKTDQAGAVQKAYDFALANWAEQLPVTVRTKLQPDPFTGNDGSYDILLGRWVTFNRTFVPTLDAANAVMVIARRTAGLGEDMPAVRTFLGHMAGVETVDATCEAVGWVRGSGGAGLICLSETATPGLYLSGTADVDVDNGGIHVNSTAVGGNSKAGSWISGNALIDAGFLNICGGIDPPVDSDVWLDIFEGGDDGVDGFSVWDGASLNEVGELIPGPPYVPDPVATILEEQQDPYVEPNPNTGVWDHLDLPALIDSDQIATWDIPTVTGVATLQPGYYPNGISLSNGSDVTLAPDSTSGLGTIFVFGGGTNANNSNVGLYMTGGNLVGQGVTCYVTQNFESGVYGLTRINGGDVELWSPGDWANKDKDPTVPGSGYDASILDGINGIAVWQDPTVVDPKTGLPPEVHLNGNGDFNISGTLYFPDPIHCRLEGNLGEAGNQILAGSMDILGKAVISVNYDGRNNPGETVHVLLVQ